MLAFFIDVDELMVDFYNDVAQLAECKPKKRGRPLSYNNPKNAKRQELQGDICHQKKKKDGVKIYYHTSKGRERIEASKKKNIEFRKKQKKERLGAEVAELERREKITPEQAKKAREGIESNRIKTLKKIKELRKKWKSSDKGRIESAQGEISWKDNLSNEENIILDKLDIMEYKNLRKNINFKPSDEEKIKQIIERSKTATDEEKKNFEKNYNRAKSYIQNKQDEGMKELIEEYNNIDPEIKNLRVLNITDKALLVKGKEDGTVWIPKSQIKNSQEFKKDEKYNIKIPTWLAIKKDLHLEDWEKVVDFKGVGYKEAKNQIYSNSSFDTPMHEYLFDKDELKNFKDVNDKYHKIKNVEKQGKNLLAPKPVIETPSDKLIEPTEQEKKEAIKNIESIEQSLIERTSPEYVKKAMDKIGSSEKNRAYDFPLKLHTKRMVRLRERLIDNLKEIKEKHGISEYKGEDIDTLITEIREKPFDYEESLDNRQKNIVARSRDIIKREQYLKEDYGELYKEFKGLSSLSDSELDKRNLSGRKDFLEKKLIDFKTNQVHKGIDFDSVEKEIDSKSKDPSKGFIETAESLKDDLKQGVQPPQERTTKEKLNPVQTKEKAIDSLREKNKAINDIQKKMRGLSGREIDRKDMSKNELLKYVELGRKQLDILKNPEYLKNELDRRQNKPRTKAEKATVETYINTVNHAKKYGLFLPLIELYTKHNVKEIKGQNILDLAEKARGHEYNFKGASLPKRIIKEVDKYKPKNIPIPLKERYKDKQDTIKADKPVKKWYKKKDNNKKEYTVKYAETNKLKEYIKNLNTKDLKKTAKGLGIPWLFGVTEKEIKEKVEKKIEKEKETLKYIKNLLVPKPVIKKRKELDEEDTSGPSFRSLHNEWISDLKREI